MYFIKELHKIRYNCTGGIALFIDMDGVVADYRFGEGENIENNVYGTYLYKRPIKTSINILKKVNEQFDFEMFILSSCRYSEQIGEKSKWLEKNMPFIKKENQLFVISNTFEDRKMLKIDKIKQTIDGKYEKAIMIDDTHDVLFLAIKELGDKVVPYHVITLFD
ncbi:TPA: hypothetical protein GX533_00480 [Candidatus Dojkabacteria bacterium]|uniref:FCP1 homology domain-containing protein n=1 Tax=Candidatus Dojkabacteria bacterium TaxID=2099670 RepID=A0A832R9P0_9BACT|nr:hypothetical protein [Candidatus Dojkabacteria bacterium]